ncbi:hypothetical protein [Mycobacterium sp. ITM-2016-00318]|uniref:hypothetical protein n=1 Tax=Mycobacterium sp. ITM-2016-00318 TaxID=2099693 RepID=UPI000CF94324|nr:hypothetical protein [Mycobacterium sp. ITM-2016-00318]WNG93078.1 hypothetical protein C6A82_000840 [Mycobacterium sp. ITM-2016-00318]
MNLLGRAHLLSTAFGLVMVASAGLQTTGAALILAVAAVVAVLAGIVARVAATLAVLLSAAAIVVADAPAVLAALAGLSAACYLVLRYTEGGSTRVIGASAPAMLAALGFTFVGVLAASFPFELPWLPLLAPLAVFGIYVLATRPFYQAGEGTLDISSRS